MTTFMSPCWQKLVAITILCGSSGSLGFAGDEPSHTDKELVAKVAAKFFDVATRVEGWAWPPLIGISTSTEVNAFANLQVLRPGEKPILKEHPHVIWIDAAVNNTATTDGRPAEGKLAAVADSLQVENERKENDGPPRPQPYIILLKGFLDTIVKGREVYLAETFGHELSHVLLRHADNYGEGGAPLVSFAMTRQQETEADLLGMKLALKADYPYDELIKAVQAWRKLDPKGSSINALAQSHPGWTDRAILLDEKQSELWSSISAFENGVYFLLAENYTLAERCFTQVTKEAPRCYEAWANRGYCRLMRYCDGLEPDDLKELSLNQVVVGGFYRRANSIEPRGTDIELWFNAVGDLREALRLNESLILPKANLALAYLVSPTGKEVGKAAELFEQIIATLKQGHLDEDISVLDRAALLVNAGVTELANGDAKTSQQFFEQAKVLFEHELPTTPSGPIKSALLYSQASRLSASKQVEDRKQSAQRFEEYLNTTNPSVAWWTLAYDQYMGICQSEKLPSKSREELALPQNLHFRPVTSLPLDEGHVIALNDPVTSIALSLGEGTKTSIVRRTNIHRRKYEDRGLELVCSDRLIAIRLREANSPPIILRAAGPGDQTVEVHVGMTFSELQKRLAGDEKGWDNRYGTQQSIIYHYFYRLGFGVRVGEDDKITEIIVAQLPSQAIAK